MIFLARGEDQGRAAWYYMLVKDRVQLELLYKRCQDPNAEVPLDQFGEILISGWGENPPEDVVKQIEEEYGP